MNEFEKLLVEKGSQEMILVFSKVYQDQLSEDFKDYASKPSRRIEDMEIRDFLTAYGESFPTGIAMRIYNACHGNDIKTVDDLLKTGTQKFLRFRNVGTDSVKYLCEIFAKLGLEFRDHPTVQCEKMEDMKIYNLLEIYGTSWSRVFRMRIYNACSANDVETVDDLLKTGTREFLRFRNVGKKSVKSLQEILAQFGLEFK